MKIELRPWQDLRDFTRDHLYFETPEGDLGWDFFTRLVDRLENTSEENQKKFWEMADAWNGNHERFRTNVKFVAAHIEIFRRELREG